MAGLEHAGEKIARHLQEAVQRLHEDIARVELWAGALGCFARPIPEYDPDTSRFALPPQRSESSKSQTRSRSKNDARKAPNGRSSGPPAG
jgi:hypothetical protein